MMEWISLYLVGKLGWQFPGPYLIRIQINFAFPVSYTAYS